MSDSRISLVIGGFVQYVIAQLIICHVVARSDTSTGTQPVHEYCQWETFNATCSTNEVILMQTARYGRMRFGRCMREDHGSVGCSADVLTRMDRRCSAQRTCHVTVPDEELHGTLHSCPKELMPYLEASYTCISVETGRTQACALFGGLPVPPEPAGYLSSLVAIETGVGTVHCPWMIEAQPGQRVNITLYSFTLIDHKTPASRDGSEGVGSGPGPDICPWSVVLQETNSTVQLSGCSTTAVGREKLLFSSAGGGGVRIYVQPVPNIDFTRASHLLLRYQVYGCSDIASLANSFVLRHGETTVVKCTATGQSYVLNCVNDRWSGGFANCTKAAAMGSGVRKEETNNTFPLGTGILLVIGVGVVMGIAVGIMMLFTIVLCLRKRREKRLRSQTADPLLQKSPNGYPCDDHSSYCQRHRVTTSNSGGVTCVSTPTSSTTLCPYHHHIKYHMAASLTASTDLNTLSSTVYGDGRCTSADGDEGRSNGYRTDGGAGDMVTQRSSYPLLSVSALRMSPTMSRDVDMSNQRHIVSRHAPVGLSPGVCRNHVVTSPRYGSDGDLLEQTTFICPTEGAPPPPPPPSTCHTATIRRHTCDHVSRDVMALRDHGSVTNLPGMAGVSLVQPRKYSTLTPAVDASCQCS